MNLPSILKKVLMAATGLAWFAFLIAHLFGNLLLLRGPDAFNAYAEMLKQTGLLLYVAEVLLLLFLLVHVYSGVRVTLENRRARPIRYSFAATAGQATVASRSMIAGGVIIAGFLVVHVAMFKFANLDGINNGLRGLVVMTFKQPIWVVIYAVALLAVGLHLSHGIASAIQTTGLLKPRWRVPLKRVGSVVAWAIAAGFIALPIWCYFVATN